MRRAEMLQGIRLMKFEEIWERTRSRELSQSETASVPGVLERTFRRWRDRYEEEGADGAETFLPEHNERFAIAPEEPGQAFVPFPGNLDDVLCVQ